MVTKTFSVPNISCNHCVHTIQRELHGVAGIAFQEADVESKTITVQIEEHSLPAFKKLMEEIGYPVAN